MKMPIRRFAAKLLALATLATVASLMLGGCTDAEVENTNRSMNRSMDRLTGDGSRADYDPDYQPVSDNWESPPSLDQ